MRYNNIRNKRGVSEFVITFLIVLVFLLVVIFAFPSRLGDAGNPIIEFGKKIFGKDGDKKEDNKDTIDSVNKLLMANQITEKDVPLTFEEYKEIFDTNRPKRLFDTEKYCIYETKIIKKEKDADGKVIKETPKKAFLLVDNKINAMSSESGPITELALGIVVGILDEKTVLATPLEERQNYVEIPDANDRELNLKVEGNYYLINIFDNYKYKDQAKLNVYNYFSDCYKTNNDLIKIELSPCLMFKTYEIDYTYDINNFLKESSEKCKKECFSEKKCDITIKTITLTGEKPIFTVDDMTKIGLQSSTITKDQFKDLFQGEIKEININDNTQATNFYGDMMVVDEEIKGESSDYYIYEGSVAGDDGAKKRVFLVLKKEDVDGGIKLKTREIGSYLQNPNIYIILQTKKSDIKSSIEVLKVEGKDIKLFSNYKVDDTTVSPYDKFKALFCKDSQMEVDIDSCIDSKIDCSKNEIYSIKNKLEEKCNSCLLWKDENCEELIQYNNLVDIS